MIRIFYLLATVILFATGALAQDLSGDDEKLFLKVFEYHKSNQECADRGKDMDASELIRFSKDSVVVLATCEFHAYQTSWVAYVANGDVEDVYISPLSFPTTLDGRQWFASNTLMSPEWDTETKTLMTFQKGRGMGDCGSYFSFKWDDGSFYLASANYQVCCWNEEDFTTIPQCQKIKDRYPLPEDEWPVVYQYEAKKKP